MSSSRDHSVLRPDGRRVSWREAGLESGGRTLLYFHGYPGSRLEIGLAEAVGHELGLTLVAIERPGFGLSDRQPGRSLLDWPADVLAVLDARGDDRVLVSAASGGAPYALALAHRAPERVERVGLLCGLGPLIGADERGVPLTDGMLALHRVAIAGWKRHRGLTRPLVRLVLELAARLPTSLWVAFLSGAPQPDRSALREHDLARELAVSFRAGLTPLGMLDELDLIVSAWPFALEDVRAPIWIWHGQRDGIVPPAVARQFEARLPDVRAHWFAGEGHFSLIGRHLSDMLRALVRGD